MKIWLYNFSVLNFLHNPSYFVFLYFNHNFLGYIPFHKFLNFTFLYSLLIPLYKCTMSIVALHEKKDIKAASVSLLL